MARRLSTYEDAIRRAGKAFKADCRGHEVKIVHDDGLYRHLRFRRPGTGMYWFDLITWPGSLAFRGDMGDYVFSRDADMFEFFADSAVNPGYWAEKCVAQDKHSPVEGYRSDVLEERMRRAVREAISEEGLSPRLQAQLRAAVRDEILAEGGWEETARTALTDFSWTPDLEALEDAYWQTPYGSRERIEAEINLEAAKRRTVKFEDSWEWELSGYSHHYLYALHAIVWGISRYWVAKGIDRAAVLKSRQEERAAALRAWFADPPRKVWVGDDAAVVNLTTLQFGVGGLFGAPASHDIHLLRQVRPSRTPGPTLCGIDRFSGSGPGFGGFRSDPAARGCQGCIDASVRDYADRAVVGTFRELFDGSGLLVTPEGTSPFGTRAVATVQVAGGAL